MYPKMPFRSSNGYELEMFLLDRSFANDAGAQLLVRRDIPLAERTAAATRIVEWADVHGMGQLAGIAELRELISFVSSLPPRRPR